MKEAGLAYWHIISVILDNKATNLPVIFQEELFTNTNHCCGSLKEFVKRIQIILVM